MRLSSKQLDLLRDDARRLVAHTAEHRDHLDTLVRSAERELHDVEVAAAAAMTADLAQLRRLWSGQVQRSVEGAATTLQASVSAAEQHAAACHLLVTLDGHSRVAEPRANAVLVVDDYEAVRLMVARILREAGFVVRTAANGLEGLIAATQMRPCVIVTDVAMPVLDGIEATRLLKAREATRSARVIAYTANASIDSPLAETLFDAVLQKPAPPDVVLATVRHVAGLYDAAV